jgi:hypothetical protein
MKIQYVIVPDRSGQGKPACPRVKKKYKEEVE